MNSRTRLRLVGVLLGVVALIDLPLRVSQLPQRERREGWAAVAIVVGGALAFGLFAGLVIRIRGKHFKAIRVEGRRRLNLIIGTMLIAPIFWAVVGQSQLRQVLVGAVMAGSSSLLIFFPSVLLPDVSEKLGAQ
jgi:hypothetical protein